MRKVTVIAGGDSENAKTIKRDTRRDGNPANPHPKEKQTPGVQNGKLSYRKVIQFSRRYSATAARS